MFNKLTVRLPDEPIYIPDENKWSVTDEFGAKCLIGEVVNRLAAYEDSGLSPEEVQKLKKSDASKEQCTIDQHGEIHRLRDELKRYKQAEQEGRLVVLPETGISDLSDGYHTFNELYHHRAVLFSVICNQNKDKAWKSWKHADGTMFDDYFIVGITTPKGDYTYHYHKDYWGYFDVKVLEHAPKWDGHKPEDVTRLLSLV